MNMNTYYHYSVLGGFEPIRIPSITSERVMQVTGGVLLLACTVLVMGLCYRSGQAAAMSMAGFADPHMPIQVAAAAQADRGDDRGGLVGGGSVLLFITTSMSDQHLKFLRDCWPLVVSRSALLQRADVKLVGTLPLGRSISPGVEALRSAYKGYNTTLLDAVSLPDPGYAEGAMLALHEAVARKWFAPYDWVIRLNPDVLVLDDGWIVQQMQDPAVDALLVMCTSGVHTDFTIFRPGALRPDAYTSAFSNAEKETEHEMQDIISAGRYRVLPGTWVRGYCRVRGPQSPVVHDHRLVKECTPEILQTYYSDR